MYRMFTLFDWKFKLLPSHKTELKLKNNKQLLFNNFFDDF